MKPLSIIRALALGLALVAGSARAVSSLGGIPLETNVYTAAEVDALLENAGGGADAELSSNLVANVIAEAGTMESAAELHRLILADLWRRVDALEGSDGSGFVTTNAVEELVAARIDAEIGDWSDSSGHLPIQMQTETTTQLTGNRSGVTLALSPARCTVLASNGSNSYTLSFSSLTGTGVNPCLLKLTGWKTVSWPSGTLVPTAYSYNSNGNYFRVYYAGGKTIAERVYP